MATPMVSFDLVFHKRSEKSYFFFTFIKGNKVFDFWMVIPSQISETMNHLNPSPVLKTGRKMAIFHLSAEKHSYLEN